MPDRKIIHDLDFQNAQKVKNAVDPTAPQDYATKQYVDDNIGGGSISVTDGSTTVDPATSLDFTSGATVTDGGGGVAEVAVTSSFDLPGAIHAATGKTAPVDNDELALVDSAASNVLKKVLWSNVKATLKTYFDTLYTASGGAAPIGVSELIYRYTVTGSDKASIDTGADTADAGSNDWSAGDLLEVYLYARTDEAAVRSAVTIVVNNDTNSVYDAVFLEDLNTSVSGGTSRGAAAWGVAACAGGNAATNNFSTMDMRIANYLGTIGDKTGTLTAPVADATAATCVLDVLGIRYRPATPVALSRIKFAPTTSGKKFKVGTQLLVYKRRSA